MGKVAQLTGILAMGAGTASFVQVYIWIDQYLGTDQESNSRKYGFDWNDHSGKLWNYHPVFMVAGMAWLNIVGVVVYRISPLDKLLNKGVSILYAHLLRMCLPSIPCRDDDRMRCSRIIWIIRGQNPTHTTGIIRCLGVP